MTASFRFGSRSEDNLKGVNPQLINVVRLALIISNTDFAIIEGLRSEQRQHDLYAQGRSKPGPVVTWTLTSKHITGDAVDLLPINPETGRGDWDYKQGFEEIRASMIAASDRLETPVRNGGDWNRNGVYGEKGETDVPHWELI